MGLQVIVQGVDTSQVVDGVLGTRLGRRCYLARLLRLPLPRKSETDHRWLWSHWCLRNPQFKPDADKHLKVDLLHAGRLRRWLWVWLGV